MALGIAEAAKKKFGKTPTQESAAAKQLKEGYAKYVEKVQKESGKIPFKEAIRRSGGGGGSSVSQPAQQVSSVATPTQAAQVTTQPTAPTQTQQQSVAAQQVQQGYAAYVQKQQQQRQPLFTPAQQQQAKQKFVQRVAIEKQRQAEEKAKPFKQKVQEKYEYVEEKVSEKTTKPVFSYLRSKGIDLTSAEYQKQFMPSLIGIGPFGIQAPEQIKDFYGGMQAGIFQDIEQKPVKQVITYGGGAALGFAAQGVTTGITVGSAALFGAKTGTIIGASTRLATIGAGLYFGGKATYEIGKQIVTTEDYTEKGKIFGVTAKDIFIGASGYQAGAKGFDVLRGKIYTRGRQYIEVPQGEYPQLPKEQQLKAFKENIYPEFGDKAGAFHTTSQEFWQKQGIIQPSTGGSELQGLYGSTQVSTPFARIPGSSSTAAPTGIKKWFLSLAPPLKPAVAYIQPESFRVSSWKVSKTPTFEGQPYVKSAGGYPYWTTPAKAGVADLPLMKTEIEAIFRPGTGPYTITSQSYYTNINQVPVPIDVAAYTPGATAAQLAATTSAAGYGYSGVSSAYYPTTSVGLIPLVSAVTKESKVELPNYKPTSYVSSTSIPSYIPPTSPIPSAPKSSGGRSSRGPRSYEPPSYTPPSYTPPSSTPPSYTPPSYNPPSKTPPSYVPPSYTPPSYNPPSEKPPTYYKIPKASQPTTKTGKYPVLIRRFGKFKIIGYGKTPKQALSIGKSAVGTTLARTFKVPSFKGFKVAGFKTKKSKKEGLVFIEPSARALSTKSEQKEIQIYKGMKGGSRKKK